MPCWFPNHPGLQKNSKAFTCTFFGSTFSTCLPALLLASSFWSWLKNYFFPLIIYYKKQPPSKSSLFIMLLWLLLFVALLQQGKWSYLSYQTWVRSTFKDSFCWLVEQGQGFQWDELSGDLKAVPCEGYWGDTPVFSKVLGRDLEFDGYNHYFN